MSRAPVVVTGMGCVSALGSSVEKTMDGLFDGVIQDPAVAAVATALETPPAAFAVTDPVFDDLDPMQTRTSALALAATRSAVSQAGADALSGGAARVGVCLGTTVGSTFNEEDFYRAYLNGERPGVEAIRRYLANDLAAAVAGSLGARGPASTVANACASSADAIGFAVSWLEAGLCDVVVAGGADELARFPFLGFASLKNASSRRCRPFDVDRDGLNLGEGAAVLVLEREERARQRGAPVLASVVGYGAAADAHHMTAPHPEGRGLRQAIHAALHQAGLTAEQVGFVNAHGTGTRENDRVEGRVLADIFGEAAVVFSSKGATGHTLGAAGALEAVLSIGCLLKGRVPRSAGLEQPDPECVVVPTRSEQAVHRRAALSTSLAFGGTNAALVITAGDGP